MSFRLTFALLAILVAIGGYAYLLAGQEEEEGITPQGAMFYDLDPAVIDSITITYYGDRQVFVRAKRGDWRLETADGESVGSRFSGTNLLASGGLADRLFPEMPTEEQLQEYGLDDPVFRMEVGVETGETFHISLGNATPDGNHNYSLNEDDGRIFLMPQIWGEVLAEFVTDPILPSTPAPEPEAQGDSA